MSVLPLRRSLLHRTTTALVCLAVAALGMLLLTDPAGAARPRKSPSTAVASPQPTERLLGVAVPGAPTDLQEYEDLAGALGRRPEQITFYAAWATVADFPAADAARIAAAGAGPELTWEPSRRTRSSASPPATTTPTSDAGPARSAPTALPWSSGWRTR